METIIFHPEKDTNAIAEAAAILRRGGLLGIPTETVYGLGADGLNEDAVRRIFEAKGRPQDNPLILHVPDAGWLERCCVDVPETAYALAEKFWPGPLTMILPRRDCVPLRTTGGLDTVGVRCPDHPVTRAIIQAAGVPVAAPSGNTSGRPSPTCARHMMEDMMGKIDGIVDGSDAPVVGIDAINLIESGLCGMCRRTVAVTAPPEVRVRRIMARDRIPEDYARLRVQAQKDEGFYRTHCTDVLVNDCADTAAFEQRAYRALETILKEEQA